MHRYFRYAILGIRLLFPTPTEVLRARLIAQSGTFDRGWYLACNPRLPWLCRIFPIRHYVLVGEAAGLCPSPKFSPRVWRSLNPDLPPEISELYHYIASGAAAAGQDAEDRPAGALAPAFPALPAASEARSPYAVVLHLYYREMWPEFAARLKAQIFPFDLFVTLPDRGHPQADDQVEGEILRAFPQAQVIRLPNHGRDLLPFLHLAQSGLLAPYAAICKIHSKKSPHRADGDQWRDALLDGILAPPEQLPQRLAAFTAQEEAGIWIADGHILRGPSWWGPNQPRSQALWAKALGRAEPMPELGFAAGSMFWISGALVKELAQLPLSPGDFELEAGQVDGTTAHALERVIGLLAEHRNYRLMESRDLLSEPPK